MALRLAGEEFSVVQGLDALGWPREIEANDADPALKITQNGSGPDLQFQQAATISTSAGDLTLNPAGEIDLNGHQLKNTNFLIKTDAGYDMVVRNAADSNYGSMRGESLYLESQLILVDDGATIDAHNIDNKHVKFRAQDNGVGFAEVARLQGAADPYFQATLPMVLNPSSQPGTMVEGHFWYDSTAKKLKFYNGTGVETVTSA